MKYWRGYLVAAIAAACAWGLMQFSQTHTVLVDMVYPYVTRMIQDYLSEWSWSVEFCLWQTVLLVLLLLALTSAVLMVLLKWNPIQWFGWIVAGASLLFLMHTALYGLNAYAGPLADDIRLDNADFKASVSELEDAAIFYRDAANSLANKLPRDSSGAVKFSDFSQLSQQANQGFETLTFDQHTAVFSGSTLPVKELGWAELFASRGVTGMTVALTGESAVNPLTPTVGLPFAMCHELAHRRAIALDRDANLAAFLACNAHTSDEFRYSGYFMAFRFCLNSLKAIDPTIAGRIEAGAGTKLRQDLAGYNGFFAEDTDLLVDGEVSDLLTNWYIETHVLPQQAEEEETLFDPTDENAVDLSGIVNAKPKEG